MDLLTPLLPSVIGGTIFYLLRRHSPYLIPPLIVILWIASMLYSFLPVVFGVCPSPPPSVEVECKGDMDLLYSIVASGIYVGVIAFIFTVVGIGIFRRLPLKNLWMRYILTTYITLLLLQVWVVVFPWTLETLYGFFS